MKAKKVGFIGFGLIGGSIGKAIKAAYPNTTILGHAAHEETLLQAHRAGITEHAGFLPLEEFASVDLLFLCSPVRVNLEYLKKIKPYLSPDTLITDVGSVKGDIHAAVRELGLTAQFIGGHPMTGSEKTGFVHASPSLLENAYYILTKDEATDEHLLHDFSEYIASLKAIPLVLTPQTHDFATAAISHLPHVISAALVNLVRNNDPDAILKTIAAGGFKDITRISSSSPTMWQNICLENKTEILKLIALYQEELEHFKLDIASENDVGLYDDFSLAKDYRDSLPVKKASILPRVYQCFVDIKDETGVIAKVATLLAEHNISLKNIGIINSREFLHGALHIELKTVKDQQQTIALLTEKGYTVFEKQ